MKPSTDPNFDDKETVLSPNAPVFFPKWKRSVNSPTTVRKNFGGENEDDHAPMTFLNDFGRSLSGGFNLGKTSQLRTASSSAASPSAVRHTGRGTGGLTTGGGLGFNTQASPLVPRPGMLGPGVLGPRSSSWREDATQSWRGETPNVLTSMGSGSQQQMMAAAAAAANAADDGKGSSKAITVEHRMIKPGAYSTWIRVLSADIGPAQLAAVLARCEESNTKGVIHVYLREKFINRQLVQQLKSQGYKFHHFVEETQTFVYGKRPQDLEDGKELMNATAKEMTGALVISPDDQQVLLVWEGGKWTFLSGFAITRESVIDAVKRDVRTQLHLELDKSYTPRVVGGWSRAAAKFDCINEMFLCFALKSTTTTLSLDEDMHARWFNIDELLQLLDMVDAQFKQMGVEPKLDAAIEHPPGNVFSQTTLRWIKALRSGYAWQTNNVAERHVFCVV